MRVGELVVGNNSRWMGALGFALPDELKPNEGAVCSNDWNSSNLPLVVAANNGYRLGASRNSCAISQGEYFETKLVEVDNHCWGDVVGGDKNGEAVALMQNLNLPVLKCEKDEIE